MENYMKYLANVVSLKMISARCVGCGMCIEVCPHGVFAMGDKKAVIQDRDSCMECGACAGNCAFGALEVNKGVGCAAAIINGMIIGGDPACGCDGSSGNQGCC
jgi:NAD-dependent dihydropyrimidine dehydrogenase PreA subunit